MGYGTIDIFVCYGYYLDLVEGRAYEVDTLFHFWFSTSSHSTLTNFLFLFFLFLFFFVGCWLLVLTRWAFDFYAISIHVYAMCISTEFGSFNIDSCLRTRLQVSYTDASAEYDDLATSIILHVEAVFYPWAQDITNTKLLSLINHSNKATNLKEPWNHHAFGH